MNQAQEQQIETLTQIIRSRQSIYPAQYTGETVPDDAINWMLNNAMQAPSHRKVNPWRFTVLKAEKLKEFATFFSDTYKTYVAAEKFNQAKFESFEKKLGVTSHVIILTMKPNHERPLPEWENIAAVSAAVQNIYLSVTAAGYGGYWSSPSLMINHINDFLTLDEDEKCLGFFFVGVPKQPLPLQAEKGELSDYVTWL